VLNRKVVATAGSPFSSEQAVTSAAEPSTPKTIHFARELVAEFLEPAGSSNRTPASTIPKIETIRQNPDEVNFGAAPARLALNM
jgi:hypothetical protein